MSKQERIRDAIEAVCAVVRNGDVADHEDHEGLYETIGMLVEQLEA